MKIVRISSLPSIKKPGMGLAAFKLSQSCEMDTTYISYTLNDDSYLPEVMKLEPILFPFPNPVMSRSRVGMSFLWAQLKRLIAIVKFALSACFYITINRPDIVHIHSPMHFIIGFWAKAIGCQTFLTFHGTDFNHIISSKFYQLCVKPIKNLNCVSSHQISPLKSVFPNSNISLVSNGVDLDVFSSKSKGTYNGKTLIAVGTLRWHKGFGKLIETFSKMDSKFNDWTLKIIGEGPDRAELEHKIISFGLTGRVQLLGALPRSEVFKELLNADIFILSSISEGLPKVLLEAMRARCACIAFKVGDCGRVLSNSGLIIEPKDYSGLRKAMMELMEKPELRMSLGKKSFIRAESFSWPAYINLHLELYANSLAQKN
jgi:glycosyltransferase involved in cell wall biosynthesis